MWIRCLLALLFTAKMSESILTNESQCDLWASWSNFPQQFTCEAVCETGIASRKRERDCLSTQLTPTAGCVFSENEKQTEPCRVDVACPAWSSWGAYTERDPCSAVCGSGQRTMIRVRDCVGGVGCAGRSKQLWRRRCFQSRTVCREYGCNRRTYKVLPQIVTNAGKYAVCRYGNIVKIACPKEGRLRYLLVLLRIYFAARRRQYYFTRIQLIVSMQKSCGYIA